MNAKFHTQWGRMASAALVLALAILLGAMPAAADGGATLHVAQWTDPTPITTIENQVKGRETVLYDGTTYHMWYSADEATLYHTSSTDPDGFGTGTQCTFGTGNADKPAEVGSVTVLYEGTTFYMIAYEKSGTPDATKKFAIYTSPATDGTAWTYAGTVFDGSTAFTTLEGGINKIDGPYLFKDGLTYRLYFQVKRPEVSPTNYYIYTAESTAASLAAIAYGDAEAEFTLAHNNQPVLSPTSDAWDSGSVMQPWVVKDGDVYYMWYTAHTGSRPQRIGFAYSSDGYNWTKSRGNPIIDEENIGYAEPSVIKDGNTWHMWTMGVTGGVINYLTATGPFEFSSIQSAVTAASDGDTINVAPGTYVQNSGITVPEGVTLELNPGTTLEFVKADPVIGITVNGTLIAEGTESEKITFTSNQDTPAAGDWKGLSFGLTATESIIDNCVIEYARIGVNVAWTTITEPKTAPVTVQNSTFQNISYVGVSFAGHDEGSASPRLYYPVTDIEIVNNKFINVGKSGAGANPMAIFTRSVKNVEISGNLFQGGEGTYLAYLGVAFENYTFADNIIEDPGYQQGVYISTTDGNPQILRNEFTGTATASNFRCIYANGHTGLTIKNNEFYTGSSGIYITWYVNSPDVVEVLIEGNTFDGVGSGGTDSYAIVDDSLWNTPRPPVEGWNVRSWVRDGVIKNNVIKNTNGVAISIPRGSYTYPEYGKVDLGDVLIEGNTIENNTVGIQVGLTGDAKYGLEGIEAHFNNIVGNGIGVKNISVSGDVFDATNNWWGSPNGPGQDEANGVSGNVLFAPWLDAPYPGGQSVAPWIPPGASLDPEETVVEVVTIPAEGTATVEGPEDSAIGEITVNGESGTTVTVVAATYEDNPAGSHAQTFAATGYYDIHLDNVLGVNSVTIAFCPATEDMVIYYWDGEGWVPCSPQQRVEGCVKVTITADTHPDLDDLAGLPFATGTPPVGGSTAPLNTLQLLLAWLKAALSSLW